jgi:hypothetical protein
MQGASSFHAAYYYTPLYSVLHLIPSDLLDLRMAIVPRNPISIV